MYAYACIHTYMHPYMTQIVGYERLLGHGLHTYMHTYMHTYIHTYMHTYVHTHRYMYIYMYIYKHMHTTYTHTHTCTHIYTHNRSRWGVNGQLGHGDEATTLLPAPVRKCK